MADNWIATKPIFVDTARAHSVGDVVPDENVTANGWQDSVSREGSKAAKEATAPADTDGQPRQLPQQG